MAEIASPLLPLAEPPRIPNGSSMLLRAWRLRKNAISAWSDDAFRQDFIDSRMLFRRVVVANCPDAVKHVLLDNAENYGKSFISRQLLKPLGKGILNTEGETWRRQRRSMAPAFHPKRVEAFAPLMVQSTVERIAHWERRPAGAVLDVADEMAELTLDIITRTMFSSDVRDRAGEVRRVVLDYQLVAGRPALFDLLGLPAWLPRLHSFRAAATGGRLDGIIYGIIDQRRRQSGTADDLLGLLLAARDDETGHVMDDRELRDQVATIFTAGHETTANALSWTWYLLAMHPDVEAKLHEELRQVLGGRPPELADVPRLRYTRMVLDESLRLYPPAHAMSREARRDDVIVGHKVPAGASVLILPWLLHRHEKLWDRPRVFDPERMTPERAALRPRYAYIPFGGGPRICIGAAFAIQEALLILATIAQSFVLRMAPGAVVEPVGLITLKPARGLKMTLRRRN